MSGSLRGLGPNKEASLINSYPSPYPNLLRLSNPFQPHLALGLALSLGWVVP